MERGRASKQALVYRITQVPLSRLILQQHCKLVWVTGVIRFSVLSSPSIETICLGFKISIYYLQSYLWWPFIVNATSWVALDWLEISSMWKQYSWLCFFFLLMIFVCSTIVFIFFNFGGADIYHSVMETPLWMWRNLLLFQPTMWKHYNSQIWLECRRNDMTRLAHLSSTSWLARILSLLPYLLLGLQIKFYE